jgi:hypothetical protein
VSWKELLFRLLALGKTRDEIANAIQGAVAEGMISKEEAQARIDLLDRLVNSQN